MLATDVTESTPLIVAILASVGVLGLVVKEVFAAIMRRGNNDATAVGTREHQKYMERGYDHMEQMRALHQVNPRTGKVDIMTSDIQTDAILHTLQKIEEATARQTDAMMRLHESISAMVRNLAERPCQVPDVIRELLAARPPGKPKGRADC